MGLQKYDEDEEQKVGSDKEDVIGKAIAIVFMCIIGVLFFLPSVIFAWFTYQLIRNRKFVFLQKRGVSFRTIESLQAITRTRPHIATLVVLLVDMTVVLLWKLTGSWNTLLSVVKDIGNIGDRWPELILPIILVNIIVGTLCGLSLIYSASHAMKTNPWLTEVENSWEYKFEYARTPLEYIVMQRKIKALRNGEYSTDDRTPIGITLDYSMRDDIAYRYTSESLAHSLIFGSTGSGKTITMLQLATNDVKAGKGVVLVDFKASPELTAYIAELAAQNNRPFYHFMGGSPEDYFLDIENNQGGQAYYIPLNGTPGTQADMMLNIREWDTASQVYKGSMQDALQVIFHAIEVADRTKAPKISWNEGILVTLESILNNDDNLTNLAIACEGTKYEDKINTLLNDSKSRNSFVRRALDELKTQVRTIMASEYGQWLRYPQNKNDRYIDLFELLSDSDNPPVILFSFASDMQKEFSSFMGSLIFADLTNVSARRRDLGISNTVSLYADEFQGVPVSAVEDLLEKARGSRIAVTLSAQSVNQIAQKDPQQESRIKKIFDTCDNFYIHQGSVQETAERFAGIVGKTKKTVYSVTNKSKRWFFEFNFWSRRNLLTNTKQEEVYRIPTESFMKLEKPNKRGRSTMIMINKSVVDPKYENHEGTMFRHVLVVPELSVLDSESRAKKNAEHMMKRLAEKQQKAKNRRENAIFETNSEPQPSVNEPDLPLDSFDPGFVDDAFEYDNPAPGLPSIDFYDEENSWGIDVDNSIVSEPDSHNTQKTNDSKVKTSNRKNPTVDDFFNISPKSR